MYINSKTRIEESSEENSQQVEWVEKDELFVGKAALESLEEITEFEDVSIKYRNWLREQV